MTRDRERGFTLLEVLIAFIIAAIALGVMFKVAIGSLQASRVSARYEEAVVRARSHLAMATHGGSLMPGQWSGDDGGGYQWHINVTPLARTAVTSGGSPSTPLELYAVSVWITWSEGSATREVRLDTQQIGEAFGSG
jgi:general secretion pathway protein I